MRGSAMFIARGSVAVLIVGLLACRVATGPTASPSAVASSQSPEPKAEAEPEPERVEERARARPLPPVSAATRAAIDPAAVEALVARARASDTDALVVLHRGEAVVDEWFQGPKGPIESMSVTKSVVALAFGRLVTTGALESLDVPVSKFFPEWRQGRKKDITIRHLLHMTSGLQDLPMTGEEIYPSPDVLQLALCAELSHEPGTKWFYSNKAANLLPALVERIAGTPLDAYSSEALFEPMGFGSTQWESDRAGNLYGMSGLSIRPRDLARIGQLVLQHGVWEGEQLIDRAWMDEALTGSDPAPWYGQLWWIDTESTRVFDATAFAAWSKAGVRRELLDALRPLRDRPITGTAAVAEALGQWQGFETFKTDVAEPSGHWGRTISTRTWYRADGWQGQYVLVFPDRELVVVRMRRPKFGNTSEESQRYGFHELGSLARATVRDPPSAARPGD